MTPRQTTTLTMGKDDLSEMIRDVIEGAVNQRFTLLEGRVGKNEKLLTGNDDPEKGLVIKVDRLIKDVDTIQKEIKSAKNGVWAIAGSILIWTAFQIIALIVNHGLTP